MYALNSDKTFEFSFLNFQIKLIHFKRFKNIYKAYFIYDAKYNANIYNACMTYIIYNIYDIYNINICNIYNI